MLKYVLKRLLQTIPVLIIIIFTVFLLVYLAGDPVALMLSEDATQEEIDTLRAALNLDKPFIVQFGTYLGNLLQGDFGVSFHYDLPALPLVLDRIPATVILTVASMIVGALIAIPLGIWSATKKNTGIDVVITGASVLGQAIPNFWLGIMLILVFAVNIQIFPVSGNETFMHLVLPAITLGTGLAATIARLTRSNLIEVLSQDYVRTAKAKGADKFLVTFRHGLRNSLIPVVTVMAMQTSSLLGGALITEYIFSWPGIGQLLIQAIHTRDMAIIQAATFIIALAVILMNFLADITYRLLDPRIKMN